MFLLLLLIRIVGFSPLYLNSEGSSLRYFLTIISMLLDLINTVLAQEQPLLKAQTINKKSKLLGGEQYTNKGNLLVVTIKVIFVNQYYYTLQQVLLRQDWLFQLMGYYFFLSIRWDWTQISGKHASPIHWKIYQITCLDMAIPDTNRLTLFNSQANAGK